MIEIALKFALYEMCLEQMFFNFCKNFSMGKFNIHSYNVGDSVTIKLVKDNVGPIVLSRCTVLYKLNNYCVVESFDFSPPVYIHIIDNEITEMCIRKPINKSDITH